MFRRLLAELSVLWRAVVALHRPTLSTIVRRLHRRHMRLNPAAYSLRFGPSRAILAGLERRPRLAALCVAAVYGVVGVLTWIAPPNSWGPVAPETDYFRDLQTVNLALFGAQATLLGLVYPLVIALVGMLFGQRSSSDRRLDVYFSETEAVTVGGLALGLVGAIALQALTYGQLELKVVGAITVLNCLWFTANLWALGFFVLRSLDFIRPARRQEMVKSYLVNTAFRRQLHDLMMVNQWAAASVYGHLPKLEAPLAVMLPGFGEGPDRLVLTFKGGRQVRDVRFGLLGAVLKGRTQDTPPIGYGVMPGGVYKDKAVLIRGGETPLMWSERLVLRRAFRLGKAPRTSPPPASETLLAEAGGDLLGLVGSGRHDEFDARMDEAIELHVLLYRLAQQPEGMDNFSYAMESEFGDFTPLGRRWLHAYFPLLSRVGEPLDADGRFYSICADFPGRVARRIRDLSFEVREFLYQGPLALFQATLTGAVRRHLESATTPPPADSVFSIQGVGSEFYRRNLISFVAGWEPFATNQISLTKAEKDDWSKLAGVVPTLKLHLRDTVIMTGLAAQAGELQAIGWLVDVLLKWRDRARRGLDAGHGAFSLDRPLISLALIDKPWDEVAALPLSDWVPNYAPITVFDAALENLWLDTLMVLTTTLMEAFGAPQPDVRMRNGAAATAGAIFRNEGYDPNAGGHPHAPPLNDRSILESIIRIAGVSERYEEGYAGELAKLAETIKELKGPNYVSMRIYSWSGVAGFSDQTHAQLLLLAAALDPSAAPSGEQLVGAGLQPLLLPADDRAKRRIQGHLRAVREAAVSVEPLHARGVIATLRNEDITGGELDQRLAAAVAILQSCEAVIQAAREAQVAAAPIDPPRLKRFIGEVGRSAFKPETSGFPVAHFQTVEHVRRPLAHKTFSLPIAKGALTEPVLGEVSDELGARWAPELVPVVGAHVLEAVLASRSPTRRRPKDPAAYWTALQAAIKNVVDAGQTPVIVRANRHQPAWLQQWHYGGSAGLPRPADMSLQRREVGDDSYDFDLNGVAVHSMRGTGPATWVFGLETLQRVSFQRFGATGALDGTFVADPADVWNGHIELVFGIEVDVAPGPVWRLQHP